MNNTNEVCPICYNLGYIPNEFFGEMDYPCTACIKTNHSHSLNKKLMDDIYSDETENDTDDL